MDLSVRGAHLKLLNSLSWDRIERYIWGDVADYPDFIQVAVGSIRLEQDITAAQRESAATNHLAMFMPGAYAIFMQTQLLVHIPPPTKFDPFVEAEELDKGQRGAPVYQHSKRVRRGSDSRALDTTIIVGNLEHGPGDSFSFILDRKGQTTQVYPRLILQVSNSDYNEVCQLYEVAHLKLAVARLSDEHVSRASIAPPIGRSRGMQHGGRTGRGVGCRLVIIEETKVTSGDGLEETASNMS
ncbi:hypothetical protein JCGZ_18381 [Jatropha curcas]|uniref:Uncharacterized protein n=1 Tax=Jatropha curcas TaxID=180498 RepID=A0A067K1F8_JATCU|nr:hypothetical protein JCGZ_18381 [Jatropha curcas]